MSESVGYGEMLGDHSGNKMTLELNDLVIREICLSLAV